MKVSHCKMCICYKTSSWSILIIWETCSVIWSFTLEDISSVSFYSIYAPSYCLSESLAVPFVFLKSPTKQYAFVQVYIFCFLAALVFSEILTLHCIVIFVLQACQKYFTSIAINLKNENIDTVFTVNVYCTGTEQVKGINLTVENRWKLGKFKKLFVLFIYLSSSFSYSRNYSYKTLYPSNQVESLTIR